MSPTKRVPTFSDGELSLPLPVDMFYAPLMDKLLQVSPEKMQMIRAKVGNLIRCSIIRPSKSPRECPALWIRNKHGTFWSYMDCHRLNSLVVLDNGDLGDMRSIFAGSRGKQYLVQIDVASVFHQIPIAEKNQWKTAFRKNDGRYYDFNHAGFGLAYSTPHSQGMSKTPREQ